MGKRFNPPPSWPEPPSYDIDSSAGFAPDPSWPAAPGGWRLDFDEAAVGPVSHVRPAVLASEHVPASEVRSDRSRDYPSEVISPGNLVQVAQDKPLPNEWPAAKEAKEVSGRRRLVTNLILALVGVLMIVGVSFGLWWMYTWAITELPAQEKKALGAALLDVASTWRYAVA